MTTVLTNNRAKQQDYLQITLQFNKVIKFTYFLF